MKDVIESVRRWQEACGDIHPSSPEFPPPKLTNLRIKLLEEEFDEYLAAEEAGDMVGIADGLGDMIYVIVGTALHYGIPLDRVMEEICTSNDTKVVNGKIMRRADGKIMKPSSYVKPNLREILYGAGNTS